MSGAATCSALQGNRHMDLPANVVVVGPAARTAKRQGDQARRHREEHVGPDIEVLNTDDEAD